MSAWHARVSEQLEAMDAAWNDWLAIYREGGDEVVQRVLADEEGLKMVHMCFICAWTQGVSWRRENP